MSLLIHFKIVTVQENLNNIHVRDSFCRQVQPKVDYRKVFPFNDHLEVSVRFISMQNSTKKYAIVYYLQIIFYILLSVKFLISLNLYISICRPTFVHIVIAKCAPTHLSVVNWRMKLHCTGPLDMTVFFHVPRHLGFCWLLMVKFVEDDKVLCETLDI